MTDQRTTAPAAEDARLAAYLADARVAEDVFALRPDYRVLLIAVAGVEPGPSDEVGDDLLQAAESATRTALGSSPVEELPHVASWREAYRAFGAKPQRTRNSLEALIRRAESGLPRINRLTDIYNAISVIHQLPVGGEDLDKYAGTPRLIRSSGTEPFDTVTDGEPAIDRPESGEVVWCDEDGVTCRRWNWRQGRRTQLTPETTTALFILDALAPLTEAELHAAGEDLVGHLRTLGPHIRVATRLLGAPPTQQVAP